MRRFGIASCRVEISRRNFCSFAIPLTIWNIFIIVFLCSRFSVLYLVLRVQNYKYGSGSASRQDSTYKMPRNVLSLAVCLGTL